MPPSRISAVYSIHRKIFHQADICDPHLHDLSPLYLSVPLHISHSICCLTQRDPSVIWRDQTMFQNFKAFFCKPVIYQFQKKPVLEYTAA